MKMHGMYHFVLELTHCWRKKGKKKDPSYRQIKKHIENYSIPNVSDEKNDVITGAFKLGRSNLKIYRKGWLYLFEDTFVETISYIRKVFSHSSLINCNHIILTGDMANN
eukprot:200651_1